jgi:ParB-like chromosome segregation protein Spo0J
MNKQFGTDDGHQFHDRKAEELQKMVGAVPAAMKPDSQPTSARFSASRNLTRVPINEIVVGARLGALDDDKVREIAESMARSGQRHAITVRWVDDQIMLVTGRHRLEGATVLGWQDIEAEFIAGDDIDAQLWEIAENLFRAELTVLERAEHIAKYVELIALKDGQADHPVAGGKQPSDKGISKAARELQIATKSDEARRKEIGRALKVNAICPEAKAAAKAAGLDTNRSALLKVANEPTAELQVKKTSEIVAGKASTRLARTAGASGKGSDASNKSELNPSKFASNSENDQPQPASTSGIDQSKPASIAVLVEFAKFMLARIIRQGDEVVVTLMAAEEVKEFNRLANRVRLVSGDVPRVKN